jgi:pimeloyl-ACP methyl ester carboxylesterase
MKVLITLPFLISLCFAATKYNSELDGYSYPFKVETFKLSSQNQELKMAYMDLKPEKVKKDKVVVLLHGKNFAGYYFERMANDLVDAGYRVIIPDQIGFGKSTKVRAYQFSFYQLSYNTKSLLDSLGIEKFDLVGHSMGGMLATHMTYLYPKSVTKLVLINPIGLEPYLKFVEFKDPAFFHDIEKKKTANKMREYQKKNYYDGKWSERYEKLLLPHIGQMNGKDWDLVAWNNALTYGPIFNEDITSKMSQIKNKTFLVIGTRDQTGPGRSWKKAGETHKLGDYKELAKKTFKRFPNAKLHVLKGLGHMPQFEDYKKFSSVFLPIFN